jgi:transferase hexapeptide repeat containing protein
LDANYHYVANFKKGIIPRWTHPIEIGRGCWICNTTTITGGTVLPDFTIVASNSLVGKDYSDIPESSMIGGIPAKLIATGFRKVENSKIECQVTSYYRENPDGLYHMSENETMDNCSFVNKFK